jgi:hypothetical protein
MSQLVVNKTASHASVLEKDDEGQKGRGRMGIDLSDKNVTVEISIHVDTAFFTQNKPENNNLKIDRLFVREPVCRPLDTLGAALTEDQ